jgi:hypothetical protein
MSSPVTIDVKNSLQAETGFIAHSHPEHLQRLSGSGIDVEELYAVVGYLTPGALPELRSHLRAKYSLTDEQAGQIEGYVHWSGPHRSQVWRRRARMPEASALRLVGRWPPSVAGEPRQVMSRFAASTADPDSSGPALCRLYRGANAAPHSPARPRAAGSHTDAQNPETPP